MTNKTDITVSEICKTYGKKTPALSGVSLTVGQGSFFALLGPNGAGKTTLTRILASLSVPDSGEVRVGGIDPGRDPKKLQRLIGVSVQDNDLDPRSTARKHLFFQSRLFGMTRAEAGKRTEELLRSFGLETEADKKSSELSGGNKRKLHCALALVHRPRILFLDEPTVGMDPEVRRNFWSVINGFNKTEGATIFLTTQYLEEADWAQACFFCWFTRRGSGGSAIFPNSAAADISRLSFR